MEGARTPASSKRGAFCSQDTGPRSLAFHCPAAPLLQAPTADDKDPAANYPADGESLKWDCQSKGWPLCLQWDNSEGGLKVGI